jgi:hypothetical protein
VDEIASLKDRANRYRNMIHQLRDEQSRKAVSDFAAELERRAYVLERSLPGHAI